MKKSIFEFVIIWVVFLLLLFFMSKKRQEDAQSTLAQPWFYALVAAIVAVVVDKILDKWFLSDNYKSSSLAQFLR